VRFFVARMTRALVSTQKSPKVIQYEYRVSSYTEVLRATLYSDQHYFRKKKKKKISSPRKKLRAL